MHLYGHPLSLHDALPFLPFGSTRPAARLTGENPMALGRTLSIIKPDAVAKNFVGEIYSRFEKAGLKVAAAKMKHLSRKEAEGFYALHRERPFFNALVDFMISGPDRTSTRLNSSH